MNTPENTQTQVSLTGASKQISEETLQRVLAVEVRVAREQHRRGRPAHVDALLMGGLVLELILVILVIWRKGRTHETL